MVCGLEDDLEREGALAAAGMEETVEEEEMWIAEWGCMTKALWQVWAFPAAKHALEYAA